ncbi:LytR C-terminal domain-containing protein [Jatrophihabitans endophyticus]|uniref:LytR C-terminal domain-containing protein n=1 Tax=Jatrophihabitans endophyticus TaxID=1206085 RepID=UPI0019F511BA|nr:LytR C-terminal domain-containing protein [Jatrophihabitans endophyticus]MBE7187754.1 LytR C-terminal domain-containing protein [Jatrophihabitans endophyticus]
MLAVVGVAVLVVAVIALHDPKNPSAPDAAGSSTTPATSSAPSSGTPGTSTSSAPTTSATTSSDTKPTVSQFKADFPLVVLNNTTIQGLAAEAAQRFEQGGWKVTSYGNLDNTIISTCAYYDPTVRHAKGAAKELQREYPTIQRVEPKFEGLVSGPVVVVLTPDYSNG